MSGLTSSTTRFTIAEFERLVESDALHARRVELVNGRIYFKTQRPSHMHAITKGAKALQAVCPPTEWVVIQGTLRLDRYSAPDPDLMWVPVAPGSPEHQWPTPILLIEVSDTTYKKDVGPKLRKYAQAGVRDYWVENLAADRIEVYRDPQNPTGRPKDWRYASVTHHARGTSIALLARPAVTLAVHDLLP